MRGALAVFLDFTRRIGHEHPYQQAVSANYRALLREMGKSDSEIEEVVAGLVGNSK